MRPSQESAQHTHTHFNALKYTVSAVWKGNEQIIYKIRNVFFPFLTHTHTGGEEQICFALARHAHNLEDKKTQFHTRQLQDLNIFIQQHADKTERGSDGRGFRGGKHLQLWSEGSAGEGRQAGTCIENSRAHKRL